MREEYEKQVGLLLDVLPLVFRNKVFALKGGTAINFFLRDMPRLSVDIDLQYVAINSREEALSDIKENIKEISTAIQKKFSDAEVGITKNTLVTTVRRNGVTIKIEPNTVIRGTLYPPENRCVCAAATKKYQREINIDCISSDEVYAGKLCAALDRQHPRDLFDVLLLKQEGQISRNMIEAFLIYLISHNRPINELLNPNKQDITRVYREKFQGMTDQEVSLEALQGIQDSLATDILNQLTDRDKAFLLGFKRGTPDWNLFPFPKAQDLPAVKWKQRNLGKMKSQKREQAIEKLEHLLNNIADQTMDRRGTPMPNQDEKPPPQAQLAQDIVAELIKQGLIDNARSRRLQEKIASGEIKPEDWSLAVEIATESTDKPTENGEPQGDRND